MTINSAGNPLQNNGLTDAVNKKVAGSTSGEPSTAQAQQLRQQQNQAILESQQQVSLGARNEPLALLLKAALESINEQLEPVFGENAVENAVEEGIDVSPEATADRIVNQSTAFFSAFQQQNESLDFQQQLDQFLETIGRGIDQGFAEARDILESLQVLEGDVATNIDQTYNLVQEGLSNFLTTQQQANNTEQTSQQNS